MRVPVQQLGSHHLCEALLCITFSGILLSIGRIECVFLESDLMDSAGIKSECVPINDLDIFGFTDWTSIVRIHYRSGV
jgi:hypothetical protein